MFMINLLSSKKKQFVAFNLCIDTFIEMQTHSIKKYTHSSYYPHMNNKYSQQLQGKVSLFGKNYK